MSAEFRALCLAFCAFATLAFCGCGSSDNAPTEGTIYGSCTNVDASATCPVQGSSFAGVVQPILAKSCLPACHDGSPDAAWPLTDFDDVQAWTTFISTDLLECTMPPAGSGYPISREDREAILNWIACDAPP